MERVLITAFLFVVVSSQAFAIDYFNQSIDYWNSKRVESKDSSSPEEVTTTKKEKDQVKKDKFSWNRYLNPKTTEDFKEVFREGDYTPPTPLLEVAKNPSDENIKNWFAVVKKKNEFLAKINIRMGEYLKKHKDIKPEEKQLVEQKLRNTQPSTVDFKRFRFRMYFESSCPHCKRMMPELIKLQNMGFFVELRQIDHNQKFAQGLPFPVTQASQAELKEKNINAWPVLFVGDTQKKVIYRINGYQSADSIISTIQSK